MKLGNRALSAANTAALLVSLFFAVYRAIASVVAGELWQAVMAIMTGLIGAAAVFVLSQAKQPNTAALFAPLLLLAIYGLTGFTLRGFSDFTASYIIICCISLLYANKRALLVLLLAGGLFTAFLALAAPLLPGGAPADSPRLATLILLLPLSALLYFVCGRSESRRERAEREDLVSRSQDLGFFLAGLSHELRAPMNAIMGMSGAAQDTDDPRGKDDCLRGIDDAAAQMLGVINDILDMAKIESGKLELANEEFDFADMLRRCADEFQPLARAKRQNFILRIDDDIPDILIGDELRLTQVIVTLLANVVKSTPEGGSFRLEARLAREDDLSCSLKVKIGGVCPYPQEQENSADVFRREDDRRTRRYGGAGVGIAVAERIVEMMGGRMRAVTQTDGGAAYAFITRLQRCAPGGLNPGESFRGYNILLAEDVAINREIVLALLEPLEVNVDCAENGAEAVRLFASAPERYDLILLDIQMPEMSGYEAAHRIRAMQNSPRAALTPIVAMTDVRGDDTDKYLQAGMDDWVEKPIDFEELLSKLRKYLTPGLEIEVGDSSGGDSAGGASGEFDWSHGLAWSADLETGHPQIDAQHKQLFRLTSALVDACAKGQSTAVLGEALNFLAAYTIQHFADEEKLQKQYAFPGYALHKKAHDNFKATVTTLIAESQAGESAEELSDKVFSVIVRWLVRHIKGEDAKIADHIRAVSAGAHSSSSHTA
ncbi:MAG: bacteriohemerythrin [Gracilibacteraceae bacterium]|jgi:hemerythrin-like metal-binding protein|nr:bacteriohemerythrin [Gracilibacteraceae bacterium]